MVLVEAEDVPKTNFYHPQNPKDMMTWEPTEENDQEVYTAKKAPSTFKNFHPNSGNSWKLLKQQSSGAEMDGTEMISQKSEDEFSDSSPMDTPPENVKRNNFLSSGSWEQNLASAGSAQLQPWKRVSITWISPPPAKKICPKPMEQLMIHHSDTAVKPIIGNTDIDIPEKVTYKKQYL